MATLSGKVTDKKMGTPVPDADVRVVGGVGTNFGKKAVTDKSGNYKIKNLIPGKILVEATLQYNPLERDKTITTGNATLDFRLTKA
jgi:uncharacterized protein YfaS (alpha-2-macroglobulin family)